MSTSTCVSSSAASAASSAPKRGALIVFEGLDRSGKSTQAAKLVDVLNESGRKASLQRFPDRSTVIGGLCDAYLQQATQLDDRCIHLLFSANRFEAVASILERINRGETVVVDRYSFSGIAYSVFKGLDWDWCCAPEVGLPKPDSVYFLTVSDQVAAARGGFGEERYEKTEIQRAVRAAFETMRDDTPLGKSWETINADDTVTEVASQIMAKTEALLTKVADSKLETFVVGDFKLQRSP